MREEKYQTEKIQVTVSESISLANGHQRPHQTKKFRSLSLPIKDLFLYDCSCFNKKKGKKYWKIKIRNWFLLAAGEASCFPWGSSFFVTLVVLFWSYSYVATLPRCLPSVYPPKIHLQLNVCSVGFLLPTAYHSCCIMDTIHVDSCCKPDQWAFFRIFHTTFYF